MRSFRVRVSDKTYHVEVDDISKSPLQVTVNGRSFAVEVEWQGAASEATVQPEIMPAKPVLEAAAPVAARPALPPTPQLSESERASAATVDAPMPGVILEVRVKPGQTVSRSEELCVLEAMKMRNSIRSPREGEVLEVLVAAGAKVAYGDPLIRFAGPAS